MTRVRSDACFRLPIADVRRMIEQSWSRGVITWTLGVSSRHEHRYARAGAAERGVVALEYDTIYHGQQRMTLEYERVSAGFGGRLLWRCPAVTCGRGVATLFRPHGGAYFLCRHCWNVGYASQYQSKRDRAFARLFDLSAASGSALSDGTIRQLEAATERTRGFLDRVEGTSVSLPRGRPSLKRQRAEVRVERAAERAARPKLPPGRPRTKRAYEPRKPLVLSEKREETVQAFCPKCQDRRDLVDGEIVTFSNGRPAMQGKCKACGTRMARIVSADKCTTGEAAPMLKSRREQSGMHW
jgi:hypothetical protein